MQEKFSNRNEEDSLRDENAFLKMKLMLEHGATLSDNKDSDMPPEVENMFLQSVAAFEKQFQEAKQVKIYDKIGRPSSFQPHTEISDENIETAWKELRQFLNNHGIDLDACSPSITNRELYRFTTEELFQFEVDDINLPGWMTHFIYDEFYPDPVYDNTRLAGHILRMIFRKEPLTEDDMIHFRKNGIQLNENTPMTEVELRQKINRFKECFEEILFKGKKEIQCVVNENQCTASGIYKSEAISKKEKHLYSGKWEMCFEKDIENGYWYISRLRFENISF